MKRIIIAIFAVLFACSVYGCTLNVEKSSQGLTTYTANLTYLPESHTVSGEMSVDYINLANSTLNSIYFNIYPNAFREGSQQDVISLAKYSQCYYNGASYGGINIEKVYGKSDINFEITGVDENILKVNLSTPLLPTKTATFTIEFEIVLPNISHRFGYGENTINLGNFLPVACVYENGKWCEIEYQSNGDPFFSQVANYNVNFTYPQTYQIASTGETISESTSDTQKTAIIKALAVRDFAIVLSDKFAVASEIVDNIKVNYFYYDDANYEQSLQTAVRAISTYNSLFGTYPYAEIDVVQANFCIGGMEFPNIVLIGDEIEDFETYQTVIVHELAHQWWYGVVGNNQTDYAWLDEGLAEFSTALFYEKNNQYETTYSSLLQRANSSLQVYQTVYSSVLGEADTTMNRSLSEFRTETEYVYTAYVKGFLLLDSLSALLSEKVVVKCLKNYFKTYAFSIATPAHLIASFEKTTSCNLETYFNSWINGKVVVPN